MSDTSQSLLAPGLLEGQVIAVAGRAGGLGRAAAGACGELGAHVEQLGDEGHRVDLLDERAVEAAISAIAAPEGRLDTVVVDAASLFEPGQEPDVAGLRSAAGAAWVVARAAATTVMIEASRGGKLVLLAPAAGPQAGPTRAALENMARTLSIEWARYGIRITAIAPGEHSRADDVAQMVAYLASPGGDYFSGCVFSLDGEVRA
jgi:NAD(P)-dependent dehydrogenase (short-subunit alcohol dehydrogenase family)